MLGPRATCRSACATSGIENASSVAILRIVSVAHGDRFDLGEAERALAPALATESGLLEAAERQAAIAAIDRDQAGLQLARQLVRAAQVACPHLGRKAVVGVVRERGDMVEITSLRERDRTQHRSEDFIAHQAHLRARTCKQGRLDEVAVAIETFAA